ncbi:MAG: hypothetical protein HQK51_12150 [Oligoflexia bacterium]|nr:hypothetical protein [Oligoflexia bacterium]
MEGAENTINQINKINKIDKIEKIDYFKESTEYLHKVVSYVGKLIGTVIAEGQKLNLQKINCDFKWCKDLNPCKETESIIKKLTALKKSAKKSVKTNDEIIFDNEFYTKLGKDIIELTKSNLKSDNLTIIDISKYKP